MARSLAGVILGYLIFGVSAAILFQVSGQAPHKNASTTFMIWSTLYGASFAAIGGYVAARIAGRREILHAAVLGGLIALIGFASLIATMSSGRVWSMVATIAVMAPFTLIGGWM
jgi:hypothetical protein